MLQESLELSQNKQKHREGIDKAKREGKYTGRKKIAVDQNLLHQIAKDFEAKKITETEAMKRVGVASRSTFYRRLREFKNN